MREVGAQVNLVRLYQKITHHFLGLHFELPLFSGLLFCGTLHFLQGKCVFGKTFIIRPQIIVFESLTVGEFGARILFKYKHTAP